MLLFTDEVKWEYNIRTSDKLQSTKELVEKIIKEVDYATKIDITIREILVVSFTIFNLFFSSNFVISDLNDIVIVIFMVSIYTKPLVIVYNTVIGFIRYTFCTEYMFYTELNQIIKDIEILCTDDNGIIKSIDYVVQEDSK